MEHISNFILYIVVAVLNKQSNQSINQSINQTINQSFNQPTNQSINQKSDMKWSSSGVVNTCDITFTTLLLISITVTKFNTNTN